MTQTNGERLAYMRGYSRGNARNQFRTASVLSMARGYRALTKLPTTLRECSNCDRWKRGGDLCVWGICRADFQYGAGEPRMWTQDANGNRAGEIVTTEDFSCPNFIPSEKRP